MRKQTNELQVVNPPQLEKNFSLLTSHFSHKRRAFTLAEGATHVDMPKGQLKPAFTLAEVLITLGIIGVVAALTLPTLIQNYQKQVYVNQLKKTYSTLSQGFKKMLADEECFDLKCVNLWAESSDFNIDHLSNLKQKLKQNINMVSFNDNTGNLNNYIYELNDNSANVNGLSLDYNFSFVLPNGAVIYNMFNYFDFLSFVVDVNGEKGPNVAGRDIFFISVTQNGDACPTFGTKFMKDYFTVVGDDDPENNGKIMADAYLEDCSSSGSGTSCMEKIVRDGWVMNY